MSLSLLPPICSHPDCNNHVSQMTRSGEWFSHCSRKCRGQHNSLKSRETAKQTCLTKYGFEHTNNIESKKNKSRETCLTRYGVDNPTKSSIIVAKREVTYIERFGASTNLLTDDTRKKSKKTCLEKFGVEHQSKNAEVRRRQQTSGFFRKEYVMPSGRIVLIRGFEDRALDDLLKIYHEDDIVVDVLLIPVIHYIGNDNKDHVYYPDMHIPKDNLIIEVKSTYYYNLYLAKNLLKEKACIEAGFDFRFMVY